MSLPLVGCPIGRPMVFYTQKESEIKMNNYITGSTIKSLREKQNITQSQLAEKLSVSDKAVSKWETGRGLPDISLIEPLAAALRVSVPELLSGQLINNQNRSANIMRSKLYVCPICGNIFHSMGNAMISCCGITLPPLEADEADSQHQMNCETVENEYFISSGHTMTKDHYISFIAYCTYNRFEIVKLYPEGSTEARFLNRGHGILFWYCNRHGLFSKKI